ncbi:MAG: Shikimate kinase [Herbinix sp.]|jgi:shikimate kinase|nr:Shikimate kinase [Herbinix sp.]
MDKIKSNIILIGFMGSGKTSVGQVLAHRLSYRFMDTDQVLEKQAGDTINHIFQVHGEEYFRDLETRLLQEYRQKLQNTILSTGGGLILREQNSILLKEIGYVVYLKASKETTLKRLKGDTKRPLLAGEDLDKKVDRLLTARMPIYEKASQKIVITDNKAIDDIVYEIMEAYMRYSRA